jgi:hypothetical protein
VPGHKIENKISDAGTALAFPFSGWTIYGYWLNGEFSRGKPGLSIWHTPIVKERLVTDEERRAKHEAWKKQVENASLSRSEAASALLDMSGRGIPTL